MPKSAQEKPLTRLTVTLGERDYAEVCQLAEQQDVSAAWIIRRAVERYLRQSPEVDNKTVNRERV